MKTTQRLRNIVTTVWGMAFVIDLIISIYHPTYLNWFLTGIMAGGLFIMFLSHSLMMAMEEHSDYLYKVVKDLFQTIDKLKNKKSKK